MTTDTFTPSDDAVALGREIYSVAKLHCKLKRSTPAVMQDALQWAFGAWAVTLLAATRGSDPIDDASFHELVSELHATMLQHARTLERECGETLLSTQSTTVADAIARATRTGRA